MGHLFPKERDRLDAEGWAKRLDIAPYVRAGREWVLNKREDGACVFLDDQNRCLIHAEFGEAAKPLACRIFPFSVRPTPEGWQASLRYDCPSVTDTRGDPLGRHAESVQSLASSIPHNPTRRRIRLKGRMQATIEEQEGLTTRLIKMFNNDDLPAHDKFIVFAQLASALHNARLKKVRDGRFLELVELLLGGFAAEMEIQLPAPTQRQHAMARQFVMACAEHLSLSELRKGAISRWKKRSEQLATARAFLNGRGQVPLLPGFSNKITFDELNQVSPASKEIEKIDNLMLRYSLARFSGESVFGAGYYNWPVTSGLGAAVMSFVAIGWVARYVAASEQRAELTYEDTARAVRVIDRGVARVRALGTFAERGRIAFLMQDEGLARLLERYWMTTTP